MDEFHIEPLDRAKHRRDGFSCGNPTLDTFLQALVGQYEKRKLGQTFVLLQGDDDCVLGYYTLASSSIPYQNVPPKTAKKLPRHPVPVVLLARLAVDQSLRGKGLGADLLVDALKRVLELSRSLGIFAVEVDAIDEDAKRFYLKHGFAPLLDDELHLYLPLATIERGFS